MKKLSFILMALAAVGLATRPRMSADWDKLAVALNLKETQHGILNNLVGFAAKAE